MFSTKLALAPKPRENMRASLESIGSSFVHKGDQSQRFLKETSVGSDGTPKNGCVSFVGRQLKVRYHERPADGRKYCKACYQVGHLSSTCMSKNDPKCGRCLQMGHDWRECKGPDAPCGFCSEQHRSNQCPLAKWPLVEAQVERQRPRVPSQREFPALPGQADATSYSAAAQKRLQTDFVDRVDAKARSKRDVSDVSMVSDSVLGDLARTITRLNKTMEEMNIRHDRLETKVDLFRVDYRELHSHVNALSQYTQAFASSIRAQFPAIPAFPSSIPIMQSVPPQQSPIAHSQQQQQSPVLVHPSAAALGITRFSLPPASVSSPAASPAVAVQPKPIPRSISEAEPVLHVETTPPASPKSDTEPSRPATPSPPPKSAHAKTTSRIPAPTAGKSHAKAASDGKSKSASTNSKKRDRADNGTPGKSAPKAQKNRTSSEAKRRSTDHDGTNTEMGDADTDTDKPSSARSLQFTRSTR